MTTAEICSKYHVTQEQIDACQRWEDCSHNRIFYTVESQSQPGVYYKVVWNEQFHCLQCLPHTGTHCPASLKGLPCWHKRAAVAAEQLYKQERNLERQREQAEIEATAEYQLELEAYELEIAMAELEESQRELEIYLAEVDEREAARKAAQAATI